MIAALQGIFNFLMIWMFSRIGVALARLYRKKILKKYLQLHISFYDITKNSPGALLTRLSIDTMQLNNLVFSTVVFYSSSWNYICFRINIRLYI